MGREKIECCKICLKNFWNNHLEKVGVIATVIISVVALKPVFFEYYEKPIYSAVINSPVGWSKDEKLFILNNNSEKLSDHSFIEIRSYAIMSDTIDGVNIDYFDDNNPKLPIYSLDNAFKKSGNQKGELGYIKMLGEVNPFEEYSIWNVYEFGANFFEDIRMKETNFQNFDKIDYGSIELVIFTIIWNEESYKHYAENKKIDTSNITILATTENGTREIKKKDIFFKKYYEDEHSVERRESEENFWDNRKFASEIYDKFIEIVISEEKLSKKHS